MRTRICWFLIGFFACLILGVIFFHIRYRPVDITENMGPEIGSMFEEFVPWSRSAKGLQAGRFHVWTPADSESAGAWIMHGERVYPQVFIRDSDADGIPDCVTVMDSKWKFVTVFDSDEDGIFDSHGYKTEGILDSVTFVDGNMDGTYDTRFVLVGRKDSTTVEVNIDGSWHELIRSDGKTYVRIDGQLKNVRGKNGVWDFCGE